MHVLGVVNRGVERGALERTVDRLVEHLGSRGRVGVVSYDATIADGTHAVREGTLGGDVTYDLGADGDWTAAGTGLTVEEALAALATDCAYAVVIGVETDRFPALAVGPDAGDAAVVAPSPADLDLEAVDAALERAEPYETLESLVARLKRSSRADRAGAIATFTGRVRAKDSADDARTEYLEFEKYDGVADERLASLEAELEAREGVLAVELHHRTGVVREGEDIVFVVVLAGHRGEAFRAVEDGIDRLKAEVPLFKKEVTVEDEFWVHDRE